MMRAGKKKKGNTSSRRPVDSTTGITGHMNLPTFRHTPGSSITCLGVRARANPPRLRLRLRLLGLGLGLNCTALYRVVVARARRHAKRGGGPLAAARPPVQHTYMGIIQKFQGHGAQGQSVDSRPSLSRRKDKKFLLGDEYIQ
jgi:hypothetical protein